ncbi:hypothetical protein KIPB_008615, partial [Kipferlia bialata]|eukprot:g8615.t1
MSLSEDSSYPEEARKALLARLQDEDGKRLASGANDWVWCSNGKCSWDIGTVGLDTMPKTEDPIFTETDHFFKDAPWYGYNYNTFVFNN